VTPGCLQVTLGVDLDEAPFGSWTGCEAAVGAEGGDERFNTSAADVLKRSEAVTTAGRAFWRVRSVQGNGTSAPSPRCSAS
jgi:hypothetical protein